MKRASLLVLAMASFLITSPALAAPTKEACIWAFDQAQELRRAGRLREANTELVTCSQQECPGLVRADCAGVLRQVEGAQPTIVLKAADAKGTDLTDVTVDLNGQKFTTTLDGRAIAVDPGKLSLVFSRPPWKPVPLDVVIAEGEKGRIVRATLGPPLPPAAVARTETITTRRSAAGWIVPMGFAALGATSITVAGLGRIGLGNDTDDMRATCAPFCAQSDRDDMSKRLVVANVLLGTGIATLAFAAATWFVLGPRRVTRSAALGW